MALGAPVKRAFAAISWGLLFASLAVNFILYDKALTFYRRAKSAETFAPASRYQDANRGLGAKQSTRVVLFGDSRIEQWTRLPTIPGVEFVNRGASGETTTQLRQHFADDVLSLEPDVVVLELGINDLVGIGALPDRRVAIESQCATNMRYFVDALESRHVRVVLLTIIPAATPPWYRRPIWSDEIGKSVTAVNQEWLRRAQSATFRVLDASSILERGSSEWRHDAYIDTLHLTADAYDALNGAVAMALMH